MIRLRNPPLFAILFAIVVGGYLVLFTLNVLTRVDDFAHDPDTMNYVDVARNIAAGRGIVQSTGGFNEPHYLPNGTLPMPLTAEPPGYPLLIAGLILTGIQGPAAALLITCLGYTVVLGMSYLLARASYGDWRVGIVVIGGLVLLGPLRVVATYAYSEAVSLALVLMSWWLLTVFQPGRIPWWSAGTAGLVAGAAFATRYIFLLLFPLTILVLLHAHPGRRGARSVAWYLAGSFVPTGLVLGHNWFATQTLLGAPRNPATTTFTANALAAVGVTVTQYLNALLPLSAAGQGLLLGLLLLGCGLRLWARGELGRSLRAVLVVQQRYLWPVWFLLYTTVLVCLQSLVYFDPLDQRLMAVGMVPLVLPGAALLVRAAAGHGRVLALLALVAVTGATYHEAVTFARTPPVDAAAPLTQSARLRWVHRHTTDRDLIIGDDTVDIPFYLPGAHAVAFSTYPYTDRPTYPRVLDFVQQHCTAYANSYLVLHRPTTSEPGTVQAFGSFIADLVFHPERAYAQVVPVTTLPDAIIYRVACP